MSDQFPASSNTPMMTAPAILEWLAGEIEDVNKIKDQQKSVVKKALMAAIATYLEGMSARFAETTMRAMDGDETAGRRIKDRP